MVIQRIMWAIRLDILAHHHQKSFLVKCRTQWASNQSFCLNWDNGHIVSTCWPFLFTLSADLGDKGICVWLGTESDNKWCASSVNTGHIISHAGQQFWTLSLNNVQKTGVKSLKALSELCSPFLKGGNSAFSAAIGSRFFSTKRSFK